MKTSFLCKICGARDEYKTFHLEENPICSVCSKGNIVYEYGFFKNFAKNLYKSVNLEDVHNNLIKDEKFIKGLMLSEAVLKIPSDTPDASKGDFILKYIEEHGYKIIKS